MLKILNILCHGYVAIPVIIALKKHGIFKFLSKTKPVKFESVAKEFRANQGHLRVAFHMLESLNWITRNQNDEFLLTAETKHHEIPDSFLELYSFPMEEYLTTPQTEGKLVKWIDQCIIDGNDSNVTIPKLLQGALLIPLIITIKNLQLHNISQKLPLFSNLSNPVQDELSKIFLHLKLANQKQNRIELTQLGEQMIERAYVMAIPISYRPMLSKVDDLMFGDPKSVFTRDKDFHEEHVDRTINVIASGFQHEKYFLDVEKIINDIFSKEPITEQPKYIADMGCGDGAFLKRVYAIIKEKTIRGKHLDEHPVQLIGVDYNEKSLEETDNNLSGLPHMVIHGDINDPEQLITDIRGKGINDPENILHIRSFLDHNRPYISPKQICVDQNIKYEGVYVNESGEEIPADLMMANLIEHFERWSKIINKHGIIILESHCLPADIVNKYFEKTECFYFDAIHSFSGQCMSEAEKFIMAAANAGLFPNNPPLRYPKTFPFTRITLYHFKKRNYRVRYANEKDLPVFVPLERACWGEKLQMSKSILKTRIEKFPEGQLVLEMDSKAIGVIYSQKITDVKKIDEMTSETVHKLHTPNGDIIQFLALNIFPNLQNAGFGDQLLEFALQRCSLINGIKSVVGVTRCFDYQKHTEIVMEDYIYFKDSMGRLVDTMLRLHQRCGAQIKKLLPNYRCKDADNNGYGVLIEYDIHNRKREEIRLEAPNSTEQNISLQQCVINDIEVFLTESVKRILGQNRSKVISVQQPLIEMGMDSASLLELNELISCKYTINLEADFFFQYFTIDRIVKYLSENIVSEPDSLVTLKSKKIRMHNIQNSELKIEYQESLTNDHDIAIIGMAFRFPGGSTTKEKLWQLLSDKRSAIKTLPDDRWKWPSYIDPNGKHLGIDKGGFLENIRSFDASFFRISPEEAEMMDPQQRILLELAWGVIEDAGYKAGELFGSKTAVFIGASGSDYNLLLKEHMDEVEAHVGTGTSMAILPNRVSYFFNFTGPSQLIDTACSSSLVAVHDAIQTIQRGEADQAIVGGVNIMCHPSSTIAYYRSGMLSKDGRCKTFDDAANGYVRGEGAGIILIKPLKQAVDDQDNIYGVIKGVAINHGGQASGLTVPNPEIQAKLLVAAYRKSGIDPATVSYLEAHGTGTSLGDPIEISGIKTAFKELTSLNAEMQQCGLGTIKTKLGHLEAAAGIAGLIKTVLAMKYGVMPGLQNFEKLNSKIDLGGTRFYVLENNSEWKNSENKKGDVLPKRAGVSSFGFGGANAHVVLEEYVKPVKEEVISQCPSVFTLSAENSEQLKEYAGKFINFLKEKNGYANYSLQGITYALQTGRESMDERLSTVVSCNEELLEKLISFCEQDKTPENVYHENIRHLSSSLKTLTNGKSGSEIIRSAMQEKDLEKLAAFWASGIDIDWSLLYGENKHSRISLPTYPFAEKNYWISGVNGLGDINYSQQKSSFNEKLHPLLSKNISDFSTQQFSSIFTGHEFFLSDHRVHNERVFPGVAHLEMARAACEIASKESVIQFRNIIWASPIIIKEKMLTITTTLYPEKDYIIFEVQTLDGDKDPIVHSQGNLIISAKKDNDAEKIDINDIQLRCEKRMDQKECYELFAENGLYYGPAFQGIQSMYVGDSEVLAGIALPEKVVNTKNYFKLHPSIMDAALQTAMGLSAPKKGETALPFALDELNIVQPLSDIAYIYTRYSEGSGPAGKVVKYDIDIVNETGVVCVSFKNFTTRVFDAVKKMKTDILHATSERQEDEVESKKNKVQTVKSKKQTEPEKIAKGELLDKVQRKLLEIVSNLLKFNTEDIDLETEMSEYGFDSILLIELINQINDEYDIELMPTIFFEHTTLKSLSCYLADTFEALLISKYQFVDKSEADIKHGEVLNRKNKDVIELVSKQNRFLRHNTYDRNNLQSKTEEVAIIGMCGRFPGSPDLITFWKNLEANKDLITEIPRERWDWREYWGDSDIEVNKTKAKWGGFIEDIDKFDPMFFSISPREAELMDPQQRIFLQCVWEAIEDAGYRALDLSETKTGVFAGVTISDYSEILKVHSEEGHAQMSTGTVHSILSNRISYLLNIHGPSESIDTACSSSLVAINRAVEGIQNGTIDMAISGGVNALLSPTYTLSFSKAGMLSEDGRCKTFDKSANGYVRGEGVGVVLLKSLSKAKQDRDHIYGVIKGVAENHGGHTNSLTAPNPNAQKKLLITAYEKAAFDPSSIGYIEAHGTGTELGDPIEINGLKGAFAELYKRLDIPQPKQATCALGSVKTNIGHLEAAAGIAGVIKVLLAMRHGKLPGNVHLKEQNPYIDLKGSPFYLLRQTEEWKRNVDQSGVSLPRRAGVSSFGFGGTNAHIVIEEYIPDETYQEATSISINKSGLVIVPLSAKSNERLKVYAKKLITFLRLSDSENSVLAEKIEKAKKTTEPKIDDSFKPVSLTDLAYTLQIGRQAMEDRIAFIVKDTKDLIDKLETFVRGTTRIENCYQGKVKKSKDSIDILGTDEDSKEMVSKWIAKGKVTKLAKLWSKGLNFDWNLIYGEERPKRISAPTYSFAKERYWFDSHLKKPIVNQDKKVLDEHEQRAPVQVETMSNRSKISDHDTNKKVMLKTLTNYSDTLIKSNTDGFKKIKLNNLSLKKDEIPVPTNYKSTVIQSIDFDVIQGEVDRTSTDIDTDAIKRTLKSQLSEALYIDESEIDDDAKFIDLGLDSILGVEWVKKINNHYELNIPATKVYDHPTISGLANFLSPSLELTSSPRQFDKDNQALSSIEEEIRPVETEEYNNSLPAKYFDDDIAVIGMSGRFPGASNIEEFWLNIEMGVDSITEIPEDRWALDQFYDTNHNIPNKSYSKWGGFLKGVDQFDPLFFNISPKEAELMDPQQRLFLEEAWKSVEDAGYSPKTLSGVNCGVFVGVTTGDYQNKLQKSRVDLDSYRFIGNSLSILAARVSYFLNLKGANIAIDTACSSSLVAIHEACKSIINGESLMALAGGVCAITGPDLHIMTSKMGMLSPEGRCKAFDQSANGFVPSEGVGVVILKSLQKAIEDNDNIYGIIKGSGINQDGSTNGITAPSIESQKELELNVYKTHGIDPSTISYVECHGTGTKLGDPIEIDALKQSFEKYSREKQFCAVGSVKTNIGHALTAAGVASVIKVLMAMRHKKLPPSLHYKATNEHISLQDSPFYINSETKPWIVKKGACRKAAVSSFGFSGTNAHVVIEEYVQKEEQQQTSAIIDKTCLIIIPLSAKTHERLKVSAENLLSFLKETRPNKIEEKENFPQSNNVKGLIDLAYTLQIGRESMEERVVFLAKDIKDLIDKLESFVSGNERIENCYLRKPVKSNYSLGELITDDDSKEMVSKWIKEGKVKKLAQLWINGLDLNWDLLYQGKKPRRISLPTYPFAKERYWVEQESGVRSQGAERESKLHPLVHTNTSDLEVQQFTSNFTGEEFFLSDHKVKEDKVLPGVAYIEMAKVAGELASKETVTHLENIVWAKPISVSGNAQKVKINLYPEKDHITYEVQTSDYSADPIIHSQGRLIIESVKKSKTKNIDIKEIQARCKIKIASNECYTRFAEIGLNYGPAFQGVHELYVGDTEALGRIELPETATDKSDMFRLHPSIMDAALQTTMGLNSNKNSQTVLPFSLKEVCIINELPTKVYAYVRHSDGVDPNGSVVKFDIDIADEAGGICVSLKEFTVRVFSHSEKEETGMIWATSEWREHEVKRKKAKGKSETEKACLFLLGVTKEREKELKKELTGLKIEHLDSKIDTSTITQNFQIVFGNIKEKLETKSKEISYVLVLFQGDENRQACAAFNGLFKTARIENPAILGKVIEVRPNEAKLSEIIVRELEPETFNDVEIRYTDELKREAKKLKEIELGSKDEDSALIKEGGVYWITGGLGGLGRIFAEHLNKTKNVKLILSGRSELDNTKQTQLETLKATGISAEYLQGDISIQEEIEKVVRTIKEKHNQLDGIIHSAGVIRDAFIIKKTEEDIEAVFKPKISGILNIDEVTKNEKLDFVVLFSSIAGAIGNVGQSDYSSANAFLDVYAGYRNELVKQGNRSGKTISINWPLWEEGGMVIDEQSKRLMKEMLGICPLKTKAGVRAFDKALLSNHNQLVVLEGNINKIKKALFEQNKIVGDFQIPKASSKLNMKTDPSLIEKMTEYLKDLLSSTLKLSQDRIDVNIGLEKYGIDSIKITELINHLEKVFGSLSKTLFFEHQTVNAISAYFVNEHRSTINQLFSFNETIEVERDNIIENDKIDQKVELSPLKQHRFINYESKARQVATKTEEVAIVGISGRYPQSNDLNKFWQNLIEGRNCITEIPKDRWVHNDYFDSDKTKAGKVNSKWGGFLEDVDKFDPLFFNISPREAKRIDPQERLFLEIVWETLENSGYTRGDLNNDRVGVFVGSMYNYYHLVPKDRDFGELLAISSSWSIANRVSYFFNFKGPSMAINTACSSSLNAIYMACESIKRGECNYAVAGGVNLSLHPSKWVALSETSMIGSENKSRSFGDGDGYVPSEGVGAVLLKPLDEAIKANDSIYAVIKGGFINHNGKANGFSVPDPNAQADLIREALKRANVQPETIGYIETASNGSSLGDPIEISGLLKVFKGIDSKISRKIPIGSVKSNIGHCEAASGISQLTKVICQFVHKKLVPSINADPINPEINLEKSPFYIQKNVENWELVSRQQENDLPGIGRRALISSFGVGGSNVHLVLEEFENNIKKISDLDDKKSPRLVILSANDNDSLNRYVKKMVDYLNSEASLKTTLSEIAFTLQTGREAMEERLAIIAETKDELINKYKSYLHGIKSDGLQKESIFLGNSDDINTDPYLRLLKKKFSDHMLHNTLDLNEVEELALLWVKGMDITWKNFYEDKNIQKVSLPTYPFAKEICWIETKNGNGSAPELRKPIDKRDKLFELDHAQSLKNNITNYLVQTLSKELDITSDKIKLTKNLQDYGLDSVGGMKIMRGINETFQIKMTGREMLEHTTIESISEHLSNKLKLNREVKDNEVIEPKPSDEKDASIRIELSEGQKGLWVLQKFSPEMSGYNLPIAFKIKNNFNVLAFKNACKFLLKEYHILNTIIQEDNGVPYQTISEGDLFFQEENINHIKENEIVPFVEKRAKEPFDLEKGPLMRISLFSVSEEEMIVLITIHHLIFDGTSAIMFIKTLWNAYHGYLNNNIPESVVQTTKYSDFVEWEKNMLNKPEGKEHLDYWKEQLAGELPILSLPVNHSRPVKQSYKRNTHTEIVNSQLSENIEQFAKQHKANLSVVFLAIFKLLLFRYSGQDDIIVGMPTLGRPERRFEDVMGYFVNMIPLRSRLSHDQPFIEFLKEVQLTLVDGLDHSVYPFSKLVKNLKLNSDRDQLTAPVYQVSFVFQNFVQNTMIKNLINHELINLGDDDVQVSILEEIHQSGEDNIALEISHDSDSFSLNMKYNHDLFDASTIKQMMGHYIKLVQEVIKAPNLKIGSYDMLLEEEKHKLLIKYNDTAKPYSKDKTIHQLFEEQVDKAPDNTSIIYDGKALTYKELNKKVNQLGHYLRSKGIKAGDLVCICVERALEMIVGLLGILKAGGAYVPIDSSYPDERIMYMLTDSKAKFVLTQERLKPLVLDGNEKIKREIICLDKIDELLNKQPYSNPKDEANANNPAYVIYTSGSTGNPKGVLVSHKGLHNLVNAQISVFDIQPDSVVLQFASLSFDASISEIFTAICSGAALCIVSKNRIMPGPDLIKTLNEFSVTHLTLPPSSLSVLPYEELPSLKTLIVAGETCQKKLAEIWSKNRRFINAYGPTESTVCATTFEYSQGDEKLHIGKPIDNILIHILDHELNLVPIGVPGELYIGGAGLAVGYLNRQDLTDEKFIPNPYSDISGARLYKTGDIGRYLSDGNIEFLGRQDFQVKVRGYRIELGEIETALLQHPSIKNAVVVVNETEQNTLQMIGYIVNKHGLENGLDRDNLLLYLKKKLPEYMIPQKIVFIEKMPVTLNGKVDRNELLKQNCNPSSEIEDHAVANETEKKLLEIWQTVCGNQKIGLNDNFFEFGFDSLQAVQLISIIDETFDINIPQVELFQRSTIKELAIYLDDKKTIFKSEITLKEYTEEFSVTNKELSKSETLRIEDKEDRTRLFGFDIEKLAESILIPLTESQGKISFYCMASGHGDLVRFTNLAEKLKEECSFYMLQPPNHEFHNDKNFSLNDLADIYANLIMSRETEECRIGGFSIGGIFALDVAGRVMAKGIKTGNPILIDTAYPILPRFSYKSMKLLQRIINLPGFKELGVCNIKINGRPLNLLFSDYGLLLQMKYIHLYKINDFYGPVNLIKSKTMIYLDSILFQKWNSYIKGDILKHHIPGFHGNIFSKHNINYLVAVIKKCLE